MKSSRSELATLNKTKLQVQAMAESEPAMLNSVKNEVASVTISIHSQREMNCEDQVLAEIQRGEELENAIVELICEQIGIEGYLHVPDLEITFKTL